MKRISTSCFSVLFLMNVISSVPFANSIICPRVLAADLNTSTPQSNIKAHLPLDAFSMNEVTARASQRTEDHIIQGESGKHTLHVVKAPLLLLQDFSEAEVTQVKSKIVLKLTLTQTGANRLDGFSKEHLGKKIALLMAHHVIAAPVIRTAIRGNLFQVDSLSQSEANQIADLIHQHTGETTVINRSNT